MKISTGGLAIGLSCRHVEYLEYRRSIVSILVLPAQRQRLHRMYLGIGSWTGAGGTRSFKVNCTVSSILPSDFDITVLQNATDSTRRTRMNTPAINGGRMAGLERCSVTCRPQRRIWIARKGAGAGTSVTPGAPQLGLDLELLPKPGRMRT